MNRLFKVAELAVLAGLLTGGYLLLDHSRASAVPVAAIEPRDKAIDSAISAVNPVSRQAPPTIAAARPPVPLQVNRRDTYWVEDPQATAAATAAVTEQADKKVASDARAKAMIEADGYRNVKSLAKAPDGSWRGLAMRGTVEVAVSVDGNGSVSTQ